MVFFWLVVLSLTTQAILLTRAQDAQQGEQCGSLYCMNGGSCIDSDNGPICYCLAQYTGPSCDSVISMRNPCPTYVCDNGGKCISPFDAPICLCPPGFNGVHCEFKAKQGLCAEATASSGTVGICANTCSNDYNCTDNKKCCSNACGGKVCTADIVDNPCEGYCLNGGFCSTYNGPPTCDCPEGFYGDKCQSSIHPGMCPIGTGISVCGGVMCTSDDNCTLDQKCCSVGCGSDMCVTAVHVIDPCSGYDCQNGGRCTAPADVPYCFCQPGYTGSMCEQVIYSRDPCKFYRTCENGGRCTSPLDRPFCQCPSGFGGKQCEFKVKPGSCPATNVSSGTVGICANTCSNDNNCTDNQKCCSNSCGGMACTADIVANPCDGWCSNGSFCSVMEGSPRCECLNGFFGDRCESAPHPGTCPTVEPSSMGICGGVLCTTDNNCTSVQKCCRSSCGGYMCTNVSEEVTERPPLSCANMLCPPQKLCRSIVSCTTCQLDAACVLKEVVTADVDSECKRQNYASVILVVDSSNSSLYSPMSCKGSMDTQTCPSGSTCLDNQKGGGTCCTGNMHTTTTEKPGNCPTGDFFICGGTMCTTDTDCPGSQKCCSGCGNMCADPVGVTCGNSVCLLDEVCADKQRPCPPGKVCIQSLIPTCVPAACSVCEYNEDCKETSNGPFCFPFEATDECGGCKNDTICISVTLDCGGSPCTTYQCVQNNICGGCPTDKVCVDTGIDCVMAPCPEAQECVENNVCGGCPTGQVCIDTGIVCITTPCPTFKCVQDNPCGGCPDNQFCKEFGTDCANSACQYQCVYNDECGGCRNDEVCVDTGVRCVMAPCPQSRECVANNDCGGCPTGQVCKDVGMKCGNSTCPSFQCVIQVDECGGCPDNQVCIDTGIRCIKAPCPTYKCVVNNECGGCRDDQVCKDTGMKCDDSSCQPFQCIQNDDCGGCLKGYVCKNLTTQCSSGSCSSFKCTPEDEPACPLRCPDQYECHLEQNECPFKNQAYCDNSQSANCARIKPELGQCPRSLRYFSPQSLLCQFENLFPKCQNDNECIGVTERCCSSVCGNKICKSVYLRIAYFDL